MSLCKQVLGVRKRTCNIKVLAQLGRLPFQIYIETQMFKDCVRYIFASLFCMSKGEKLWNKEKYFLFHFESYFRSWDNQNLNFQIFKCHGVIKCLNLKRETQSGNENWPVYATLQNKIFYYKILWKMCPKH